MTLRMENTGVEVDHLPKASDPLAISLAFPRAPAPASARRSRGPLPSTGNSLAGRLANSREIDGRLLVCALALRASILPIESRFRNMPLKISQHRQL